MHYLSTIHQPVLLNNTIKALFNDTLHKIYYLNNAINSTIYPITLALTTLLKPHPQALWDPPGTLKVSPWGLPLGSLAVSAQYMKACHLISNRHFFFGLKMEIFHEIMVISWEYHGYNIGI